MRRSIAISFPAVITMAFLFCHVPFSGLIAQDPASGDLAWYTFRGGTVEDNGCAVVADVYGNVYVAGETGGTWGDPIRDYSGGKDIFVAKYNRFGYLAWNTFLGGSGNDEGTDDSSPSLKNSLVIDASGNIYVIGWSYVEWGVGADPIPSNQIHTNNPDGFIVKLGPEGNYLWHKFFGGGGIDEAHGIVLDGAGNIYITGNSVLSWGSPVFPFQGGYFGDAFLLKLDASGNTIWHTFLGTSNSDFGTDLAISPVGDIFLTGCSSFINTDGTWGGRSPANAGQGFSDAFVAKFGSGGALAWFTFMGSASTNSIFETGYGLAVDAGYVYVTGLSESTWGSPIEPAVDQDIFVAKLDQSNGALNWNTFIGGSYADAGNEIAIDRYGNLYVSGSDFNGGDMGAVACMMSNSGVVQWYKRLGVPSQSGGTPQVYGYGVYAHPNGYVYFAGKSHDGWSEANYGTPIQPHSGIASNDVFVAKLHTDLGMPQLSVEQNIVRVDQGDIATNTIYLTDPDGDEMELAAFEGTLIDNQDGTWTWNWNTAGIDAGAYFVGLMASDSQGGIVENMFVVHVARVPTEVEIAARLDAGLSWIGGEQREDGHWGGLPYYPVIEINEPVAATGFALTKLCDYAYESGLSPFDALFDYYDEVLAGFAYLFSQAKTNIEGMGIYIYADGSSPYPEEYNTSGALMALAACQDPSRVIVSANTLVNGMTYQHLMDQMVIFLSGAQDAVGSWGGDNLVTGYAVTGLRYAESAGCVIPPEVKVNLSNWIDYIQSDLSGGAGQFAPDDDWEGMMNTGNLLLEMAFVGDLLSDDRVQNALNYISDVWADPEEDPQWYENDIQVLYCLMKGFESFGIETIAVNDEPISWQDDFSTKLYFFRPQSQEDGFWIFSWYGDQLFNTCWALLTLEYAYPEPDIGDNQPPVIISFDMPAEPVAIADQPIVIGINFNDPDGSDDGPFVCEFDFGDGSTIETVACEDWICTSPGHSYAEAGVYSVSVTVSDNNEGSVTACAPDYVVIYDPSDGFVTGGGWIDSPEGAYLPDPTLTGMAHFGFVSRYKKGQSVPSGNTEFQFNAASLNFHSANYQWMIISHHKVIYMGDGTINGEGNYGFQLSAIDEELTPSMDIDLFRIRIWDISNNDELVYDNDVGQTDPNADPITAIGGGNITIHSGDKRSEVTGIADELTNEMPGEFRLYRNYPNPANASTFFEFGLPENARVELKVFDLTGHLIALLADQDYEAGYHSIDFNITGWASGQYYYQFSANGHMVTGKMTVVR